MTLPNSCTPCGYNEIFCCYIQPFTSNRQCFSSSTAIHGIFGCSCRCLHFLRGNNVPAFVYPLALRILQDDLSFDFDLPTHRRTKYSPLSTHDCSLKPFP